MKNGANTLYRKGGCLFKLVKLGILAAIVLAVALYFSLGFVADYVLKTITAGTGVDAGVSSMTVGIRDQQVLIKNFYITNPPQYLKGNAISFNEAFVDADVSFSEVITEKLIVVEEIRVVGLKLNVEISTASGLSALISAPNSNLTDIQKILLKSDSDKKVGKNETSNTDEQTSDEWKIIVKKIVFADGEAYGAINGKKLKIPLPSFTLENLGVSKGGETPSELVTDIVGKLAVIGTVNIVKAALNDGYDVTKGNVKSAVSGASEAVGNALQSLFK